MKLSHAIETLTKAMGEFGDVDLRVLNEETSDWWNAAEIIKLHPLNDPNGCMNRNEPVCAVGILRQANGAVDLVIG